MKWNCKTCGTEIEEGSRLCLPCGRKLADEESEKAKEIIYDAMEMVQVLQSKKTGEYIDSTPMEFLPPRYMAPLIQLYGIGKGTVEEEIIAFAIVKAICERYHRDALEAAESITKEVEEILNGKASQG